MTTLIPAARRIAERRGMHIPEDVDEFGIRACHPSFMSSRDFRWPFPGSWAEAPGPILDHDEPCPQSVGDGLCAGLSWRGVAAGGIPASLVLLVGWADRRTRTGDDHAKIRARRIFVIDAMTITELLKERTDAEGPANLCGAEPLRRGPLRREPLQRGPLRRVPLRREPLRRVPLRREPLRRVPLRREPLRREPLRRVPLRRVPLRREPLRREPLRREPLRREPLRREPLRRVPLRREPPRGVEYSR